MTWKTASQTLHHSEVGQFLKSTEMRYFYLLIIILSLLCRWFRTMHAPGYYKMHWMCASCFKWNYPHWWFSSITINCKDVIFLVVFIPCQLNYDWPNCAILPLDVCVHLSAIWFQSSTIHISTDQASSSHTALTHYKI